MTNDEFTKFATRLFTAFPDVWEYVNEKSPDAVATQEVWREQLRHCTYEECLLVVDGWISGSRTMYKPYDRAQMGSVIRQSVGFDRDKERRRTSTHNVSDEYQKTRNRQDYKPLALNIPELGMIFREGVAMRKKWLDGEITEAEWQERKQQILAKVQ